MAEVREEMEEAVQLPGWMRVLAIIVGIISIIAAIIAIINPLMTLRTLVILFSVSLLFIGIDRLATGISGKTYRFMPHRKAATA